MGALAQYQMNSVMPNLSQYPTGLLPGQCVGNLRGTDTFQR